MTMAPEVVQWTLVALITLVCVWIGMGIMLLQWAAQHASMIAVVLTLFVLFMASLVGLHELTH